MTHLPASYVSKLSTFLETKEARLQEQQAAEASCRQRRHNDIRSAFNDHVAQMRKWEAESIRRHHEDRKLFLDRRAHDEEVERQYHARQAAARARYHDAAAADTQHSIATLEANIRRLGLDEGRPPAAVGSKSAKDAAAADPAAINEARVLEIRRRKNVDISARREKMQRLYVAQQQQLAASADVLQKQMIEGIVSGAAAAVEADRAITLAERRKRVEKELDCQFTKVYLEGEQERRMAAYREADAAFSVIAAEQRTDSNAAFTSLRATKEDEEAECKAAKHQGLLEFYRGFTNMLVDVAAEISSRNFVTLTDGTVLKRVNPPTAVEWRELKEAHFSTRAVIERLDAKKEAAARAAMLSSASPRAKRSSSISVGAIAKSASLPHSPSMGSLSGSLGSLSPHALAATTAGNIDDDDCDTEEVDTVLETLNELDAGHHQRAMTEALAEVATKTRVKCEADTQRVLEDLVQQGLKKASTATTWWNSVLTELPPAAVFVLGDHLSGVRLLADARCNAVPEDELVTPEKLAAAVHAQQLALAAQQEAAQAQIQPVAASKPTAPAGGKAPAVNKPSTPVTAGRPGSGFGMRTGQQASLAPTPLSVGDLAEALARVIVKHHRKQLEALIRKDNASGYPASLLLVGFPCAESQFAALLNERLSVEMEEEEKTWAPAKTMLALEHNTPRGQGGIGTHRSSLVGGQGGTNPNTPHGSLFSGSPPRDVSQQDAGSVAGSGAGGAHRSHAPPTFSAAAGKHHAAAITNLGMTMFLPPVRIATIILDIAAPNLMERYRRVVVLPNSSDPCHTVWAPAPAGVSLTPEQLEEQAQPIWKSMAPRDAMEFIKKRTDQLNHTTSMWVESISSVLAQQPKPAAVAQNTSTAMLFTSSYSSSSNQPVTACAARLTRVLHFAGRHRVDEMSPQDPADVAAQILLHEIRGLAGRQGRNNDALCAPLCPPLTLTCFSLPDASLDAIQAAHLESATEQQRWCLKEVLAAFDASQKTRLPCLDEMAGDKPTIPPCLQQRLDETRQALKIALRGLREVEIESGRCLHHAHLYGLQLFLEDAFQDVHSLYNAEAQACKDAPLSEAALDALYWVTCDREVARMRQLLSDNVGLLSLVARSLQSVQLKTLQEVISLSVENVVLLLIATFIGHEKQRRLDDEDEAEVAHWEHSIVQHIVDEDLGQLKHIGAVHEEILVDLMTRVHENGTDLVREGLRSVLEKASNDANVCVTECFKAVVSRIHQDKRASGVQSSIYECTTVEALTVIKKLYTLSETDNAVGAYSRQVIAPLAAHEAARKTLSSAVSTWASYMYQQIADLRRRPTDVSNVARPRSLHELLCGPHETDTSAPLTNVQLQHFLTTTAAVCSAQASRDAVLVDAGEFAHFILAAQVSSLHLHAPTSLEDIVAPLLKFTTAGVGYKRIAAMDEHRSLFLPPWWVAKANRVVDGRCAGPRGHFYTRASANEMFSAASESGRQLDLVTWLAHLTLGQMDASRLLIPDMLEPRAPFHVLEGRAATPNIVQLRCFVEGLDTCARHEQPNKDVTWLGLPWWPLFVNYGAAAAASADRSRFMLAQLLAVLSARVELDATSCGVATDVASAFTNAARLPLCDVMQRSQLFIRCLRWLLSTATSSGSAAVLEFAFSIACAVHGPIDDHGITEYRPQPLTTSHTKAFLAVRVVTSVLRIITADWSEDDLLTFLLVARSKGRDLVSQDPDVPICSRSEEVCLAAISSAHAGACLLEKRQSKASSLLTQSMVVL